MWAIAAIAIGILFTLAANVGAGSAIDFEFLASGAFMGLSIYLANIVLHYFLSPYVGCCSVTIRPTLNILVSVAGGVIGWEFAYFVLYLAETGRVTFPLPAGRMRWLLLITIVITVLIALLAGAYNELRDRLKTRVAAEKELEVARAIQARLLPPPRVDGDGFAVTARYVPAHYVAGDFYDVLRHDDGSVGIVVADVSGKGIGASLIMASVKAMLPFVANGPAAETLRALNERLTGQLDRREFVALAYARFHPATGKLELANAGMPDPYLVSAGVTPVSVGGARLPLGLRRDVPYESVEIELRPGDRFVLLSDGIPEAARANGEQLGYDALRDTLASVAAEGEWIDALLERVRAQVSDIDDDWTAVVLERR